MEDEIHTQDGIMRVAPGLTVKEHLDDLADEGVLVKEISLYKNSGKHEIHYSINKDFKPNYELFNIPDIM
ncbi:hypothetical protein K9L97_00465 [Candidatus Woesearchaeota archaeon]|nr:hypothetical protein [Candidatus Woesearchaeota archaeon]